MSVSFASLEIARSGLTVSERGLETTGHNISNVNTVGYSRQQAMITTASYQNENKFQLGLGADVQKIRQIRATFLDNVYRQESQSLGYWQIRQKTFDDVQAVLNEPMGDGLQSVMNQFWDSWQELSKDPGSLTTRALVRQNGDALTQYVNHMGNQMDKLQTDLDSEIKVRVDEINTITDKIAKENVKILAIENSGDTANDIRDDRNNQLDRLSQLVDCQINEMQDGQVDITVGGYFLVNKAESTKVVTVQNEVGSLYCAPAIQNGNSGNILLPVKSGILKGLMEARGEVIGAKGSSENGSPNDKVDLVFAFNTDDSSAQRDNLVQNIGRIVNTYTNKGIGVRLGFTTFNSVGADPAVTFFTPVKDANGTFTPTATDLKNFTNAISGISFSASSTGGGQAVTALKIAEANTNTQDLNDGWKNTARQFVLLSDNAIDTTGLVNLGNQFNKDNIHVLSISSATGTAMDDMNKFSKMTGDKLVRAATLKDQQDAITAGIRNAVYGDVKDTKNIIPDIRNKINLVINALAREVNSLHRNGKTLDGSQGSDFFVAIDSSYPMEMGNIKLNTNLSNFNNIVTSADGSTGSNTVAAAMADLRNVPILGTYADVQSMDDFYSAAVQSVGNGGSEAQQIGNGQKNLVDSVDNKRQSIMNVSMDEEMGNMMKFQYAYGAAARALNTIDQMLDGVINRMGLVGR